MSHPRSLRRLRARSQPKSQRTNRLTSRQTSLPNSLRRLQVRSRLRIRRMNLLKNLFLSQLKNRLISRQTNLRKSQLSSLQSSHLKSQRTSRLTSLPNSLRKNRQTNLVSLETRHQTSQTIRASLDSPATTPTIPERLGTPASLVIPARLVRFLEQVPR